MSTSYAVSPEGKKVAVKIVDGKTYNTDGSRIGSGYTVNTGGGIYKMTDSGGVKVDSHNATPLPTTVKVNTPTTTKSTTKKTTTTNDKETAPRDAIVNTLSTTSKNPSKNTDKIDKQIIGGKVTYGFNTKLSDLAKDGTYSREEADFNKKYADIIKNFSEYNNGASTLESENMFKSNLNQALQGNTPMYKGGGVMSTEDWNQAMADYKKVKELATSEAKNTKTRDVYGREMTGEDILNDLSKNKEGEARVRPEYANLGANLSGKTQEELKAEWDDMYNGDIPQSLITGGEQQPDGLEQAIGQYLLNNGVTNQTPDSEIARLLKSLPSEILNWDTAKGRADEQLGYEFDKALENTMKSIDRNALQTGFFGQLPTMDYKQRNASDIEMQRSQAIAQLANQLMNDSQDDVLKKANSLMGYETHLDNKNQNAWERAFQERSYQDGRSDVNWEKFYKERQYSDNRSDAEFDKSVTTSQLTGIFQGNPTMAYTELAHSMGMDARKMEMAEKQFNHDIALDFEKLKNDKIGLSQAWARIGNTQDGLNLDSAKFMAGIKETSFDMAMEEMANRGYTVSSGGDWLYSGSGGGYSEADIERELMSVMGSYQDYLLGKSDYPGIRK